MNHEIHLYDTKNHDFVGLLRGLFDCEDLSLLHEKTEEKYHELFRVGHDSNTEFHKTFYSYIKKGWTQFECKYFNFITEIIAPKYNWCNFDFLYQTHPTIRFSLPGNVAVGDFHTDAEYNHPFGESNFIVPLTYSEGSSSVWIESEPGKKDYKSINLRPGELIQFDGNRLSHGNMINITGLTRVSFDFRILPMIHYNDSVAKQSMTTKTKFIEGEYYTRFTRK